MEADGNDGPRCEESENLLTALSLAVSLAPPRAPPFDSAQRALLLGMDPSMLPLNSHFREIATKQNRRKSLENLRNAHITCPNRAPHPHLPSKTDQGLTRFLGNGLPTSWLNNLRDSGGFRAIADGIVTASIPSLGIMSPSAAIQFFKLTSQCRRINYGPHPKHVVDMFLPSQNEPKGLVFFVHGGAWGSGLPWMYRLTSLPFLEIGLAVAVVGYRVYPETDVEGQVSDLELAACEIERRFPHLYKSSEFGIIVIGHSSGAHIALNWIIDRASLIKNGNTQLPIACSTFIGISGPYDISHHFDYEAARGVEELSPMKAACGFSRDAFRDNSPAFRLLSLLISINESQEDLNELLPKILLVHGIEDGTVPFTATAEAARIIKACGVSRCSELYLTKTGHEQAVMELMLGGKTRDQILKWLLHGNTYSAGKVKKGSRL